MNEYEFRELPKLHPNHSNPFQVWLSNGAISLLILGESYGSTIQVNYVTEDGTEVATQILEPDWEPFKKRKKKTKLSASQKEQIYLEADRLKERDQDILNGDLNRLYQAAARWRKLREKKNWN